MPMHMLRIDGVPSERDYNALPFGRQLEHRAAIEAFKATAKSTHVRAKDRSTVAAFREFKRTYKPTQWFAVNRDAHMYHDDSFEVWYTV